MSFYFSLYFDLSEFMVILVKFGILWLLYNLELFIFLRFKQWDYAYIRPCLVRGRKHREPKITETYWMLTVLEAIESTRHTKSSRSGSNSLVNSNPSCDSNAEAEQSSPQS